VGINVANSYLLTDLFELSNVPKSWHCAQLLKGS